MRDRDKNRDQLVSELEALRGRVSELEGRGEEWYRRVVDTAYEGVWILGAGWKTEYVNHRMAEMLGFTVEEMVGRSALDFVYEADLAESERRLERRNRGVGEQSEFRFRRKDGSELRVLSSTNPILDESGETIGVLGMMTDITERKRAERKVRFQAQLLDAVGQAVVATDMQGTITYLNRYAEGLYGWPGQEVMGRALEEVLVAEDQLAAEIVSKLKAGGSWSGECVLRRRDGASFPAHVTNTPVYDGRGNLVGAIGVAMDITKRKRAEDHRALQYGVSRLLAESTDLANGSRRFLQLVGMGLEWDYVGLWTVEPTGKALRCIGTWRASSGSVELERMSHQMRFARGERMLGKVWAGGEPVWFSDVARMDDFPRRAAAASAELRTGLGYPIRVGDKFVGVLELFSRRHQKPDKDSTAAIAALSDLIGQFMERCRAEEELEQRMKTLKEQARLLDLTHDAITCRDANGKVTFWNRGAEAMYGWSKEEALGREPHSLLETRFPKPLEEIEDELLREGRWEGELVQTKRDGARVVVASRWALRRDDDGRPSTLLEIDNDITEHQRLKLREHEARYQLRTALKALRESETRLKQLAELNIIGVVAADFSGNITEANGAFLQTVGYTREDLLWGDLHWDEITAPEYVPLDRQAMEQLERSGVCIPYEKEFIREDGSRVLVLVGAVLFEESRDSAFVLYLTERVAGDGIHEEARSDLVAALQAMHDGQRELEDLKPNGSSGRRLSSRELDALRTADEGLRNAVSDLRAKSLDGGKTYIRAAQSLAPSRTFLQDVEYLVDLNRRIAPKLEIRLSTKEGFPSEFPALTRLGLLNILKEALVNARRHAKARCVRVTLGTEENEYWAVVADDGQGFETAAPRKGTGRSEMRESAQSLGGELEVESEPGKGTWVRVRAPF